MKFVDEVVIKVQAGDGGNGCVAFRREKYVPRGGPSGGSGGDGGDIIFCADERVGTLLELRHKPQIKAEHGRPGMGRDRDGRSGEPLMLKVPVGTIVADNDSGEIIGDLDSAGAEVVAASGGRGGMGNLAFKRPWNRTPREAEEGSPGETRTLKLELKLLADIGIIGMPNVGKSTLVSRMSSARPKIADYPFTTLVPNLGVVRVEAGSTFVLADIPGLIPGAADGAGLGARFLRHVERTRGLLHLLALRPGEDCDPLEDYDTINEELRKHGAELAERPQVVALNKSDLPETREAFEAISQQFKERGVTLHALSAATGEGIDSIRFALWGLIEGEPERTDFELL